MSDPRPSLAAPTGAGLPPKPCVFFDRDGVVNEDPHPERYVTSPESLRLMPGFIEALRVVRQKGHLAVLITNQKGISTGSIPPGAIERIHEKLARDLAAAGLSLDAIYICPHSEAAGCDCRKPKPGSLLRAAKDLGIALDQSWMIGDSPRDMEAGKAAGCRTVMVGPKTGGPADFRLAGMTELAPWLERHLAV